MVVFHESQRGCRWGPYVMFLEEPRSMNQRFRLFSFLLFTVTDKWVPLVRTLPNRTQNVPRNTWNFCYAPLVLCTQEYTQTLFDFYKIGYLDICGILYIKIHGF